MFTFRSDSYGSDAKIITNLLRLTKVDIEPIAQIGQLHTSNEPSHSKSSTPSVVPDRNGTTQDEEQSADPLSRSNDSLSDISEEDLAPKPGPGRVQGFFTRNAPERLSSLFKRSVDSADEKIRGFWRRSASVSRSSSKDSVNLEQGVADYVDGSHESLAHKNRESKSSEEKTLKSEEHSDTNCLEKGNDISINQPQLLQLPPRSPNISINRPSSYSPVPSSPKRTRHWKWSFGSI